MASRKSDERTIEQAENQGLAEKLVQLREEIETRRVADAKAFAEVRQDMARISVRLDQALAKVDAISVEWGRKVRDLEQGLREGSEQVRVAGEIARRMQDKVKALAEIRETAQDPQALIRPVRREIAELKQDVDALRRNTDVKIAELRPPPTAETWERR